MNKIREVRPSPIAGQWYSGDASQLADQVDGYMDAARLPDLEGEVVAVVAPHAGHIYSGPVAGHAFASFAVSRRKLSASSPPCTNHILSHY